MSAAAAARSLRKPGGSISAVPSSPHEQSLSGSAGSGSQPATVATPSSAARHPSIAPTAGPSSAVATPSPQHRSSLEAHTGDIRYEASIMYDTPASASGGTNANTSFGHGSSSGAPHSPRATAIVTPWEQQRQFFLPETQYADNTLLESAEYPTFTYLMRHFDQERLAYLRAEVMPALAHALESTLKQVVKQHIDREIAEREHAAAVSSIRFAAAIAHTAATAAELHGSQTGGGAAPSHHHGSAHASEHHPAAAASGSLHHGQAPPAPPAVLAAGPKDSTRRKSSAPASMAHSTTSAPSSEVAAPPSAPPPQQPQGAASPLMAKEALSFSNNPPSSSIVAHPSAVYSDADPAVAELKRKARAQYAAASTMRFLKKNEKSFRSRPLLPTGPMAVHGAASPVSNGSITNFSLSGLPPPAAASTAALDHPIKLLAQELKKRATVHGAAGKASGGGGSAAPASR